MLRCAGNVVPDFIELSRQLQDFFRTLDNLLATPHIGYVSHGLYKTFYEDTVSNIRKWLDTKDK